MSTSVDTVRLKYTYDGCNHVMVAIEGHGKEKKTKKKNKQMTMKKEQMTRTRTMKIRYERTKRNTECGIQAFRKSR